MTHNHDEINQGNSRRNSIKSTDGGHEYLYELVRENKVKTMNHNISSFHTKFCKYPLSFKYNDFTTNFIENIIIISVVLPI